MDNFGQSILQHEFAVLAEGDFSMVMKRLERLVVLSTRFENDVIPKFMGRQPRYDFLTAKQLTAQAPASSSSSLSTAKETVNPHAIKTLKSIKISSCQIKSVEDDAFANFPELEVIDLSHNALTKFSGEAIRGCKILREINLERNLLTQLSEELFTELKNLRKINLRYNQLHTLPVIFSPNTFHHQELKLEGNPWQCKCKMSWIIAKANIGRTWFDSPKCHKPDTVSKKGLLEGLQHIYQHFC